MRALILVTLLISVTMIDATMNVGTFWFMQNNQGKFLKNLPRRPEDYGPPLATIQDPGPQQDEEVRKPFHLWWDYFRKWNQKKM